jgi:DNA (cytosine-5)-methyltransferase 1
VNVGSLFSGIGGLDHGLHRAGLRHVFFCEADPWRRDVLAKRWPGVPIYEDVREVNAATLDGRCGALAGVGARADAERDGSPLPVEPEHVDLLAGGFPCQDVSVAGQRRGLAGERSGLFHEFARVIDAFRPGWVLVENVPGLLSSNGGRDFGVVLGTLADLGYGVAWRILDSRFFGVPQRRRRVFIVGALADGDPRAAADRAGEILAVGTRCPRHPPTGTETGEEPAGSSAGRAHDGRVAQPLGAHRTVRQDLDNDTYVPVSAAITKKWSKGSGGPAGVLETPIARQLTGGGGKPGQGYPAVHEGMGVRRLTPVECERLQGLPDDWTRLDSKTPDSRRYSALGDAVTANVGEWIGCRLLAAGDGQPGEAP